MWIRALQLLVNYRIENKYILAHKVICTLIERNI
jgi:hypothetical protein